jgi:AcrR family transcriptional regulator
MPQSTKTGRHRRRARSLGAKASLRDAIIEAGRRVFADEDYSKLSLRRIAAAAGYSPAVIYQFFRDRQALFLAVREGDLSKAIHAIERAAMRAPDPAARVRRLFTQSVKYWRAHPDQYEVLFMVPLHRPLPRYPDGGTFGESPAVQRAGRMWESAIQALFDTYPRHPLPLKLAADSIMVAMHGTVAAPAHMRTKNWSKSRALAESVVGAFLTSWEMLAKRRGA